MKFRCVLTIEADNGQEAFNKLMDFVTENGIELAVSVVDDEEFERFSNELREDAGNG